ncbi:MAG: hypothetical protein ABIJ31_02885, partial [Pseudomonadota bacterium]
TKTHPSAALLRKAEILMYYSTLRFQLCLRLAYGQVFIQTRVFGQALTNTVFLTAAFCLFFVFSTNK